MMIRTFSFGLTVAVAVLCSIGVSCKKDNPVTPPSTPGHSAITFQVTFISTRWCRLQWSNDSATASHHYVLIRDGRDTLYNDSMAAGVATKVLQDTVLKPGTSYSYWVYRIVNGQRWDSATVNVRTLDTTKDDFVWDQRRIGTAGAALFGLWGASPNSVWIVGTMGIRHVVEGQVTDPIVDTGQITFGSGNGCYGLSDSNIWFAGQNTLGHWTGHFLEVYPFTGIVDSLPDVTHGKNMEFYAIAMTPNNHEVFAVGDGGTIVHRRADGRWEVMQSGTTTGLSSLAVFSPTDVYAAGGYNGGNGILIHYDGLAWSTVITGKYPPDSTTLVGDFFVSGSSTDSLYLVGQNIYKRQATKWLDVTPRYLGQLSSMLSVDARQWNDVVVTGEFGEILKWDGEKWIFFKQLFNPGINSGFNNVLVIGGEIYAVGADDNGALFIHGK